LYIAFAGMISLALAIFNMLPIPALDGGRALWVIIQKVFRFSKEKYFNIEWYINTVFFILLMVLGIYIILKDLVVFRWIHIPFFG
jgi:regulator of sigma E protease